MGDCEVKGWVRNLIRPPGVISAVVPAAPGAVHCDIVLRIHQPRGASAALHTNLIPACFGPKVPVALRAHKAVFCVIMLSDHQQETLESSGECEPSSSTSRS